MGALRAPRRAFIAVVTLVAAGTSLSALAPASHAAPAAPSGLAPDGPSVSGIPVLSWDRSTGATSYDVEVSASSGFATRLWSLNNTVNLQAVPQVQLPVGDVWWRVRSTDGSGDSAWSTAHFRRSALAAPTTRSPADGAELRPPDDVPALAWEPVAGVARYEVEISPDENFTDPTLVRTHRTGNLSLVVPGLQAPNTYFWRVRGELASGVHTAWSTPRSYEVLHLPKAVLQGPTDSPDTFVREVVLDWEPIPGAAAYDLQVSTDKNFLAGTLVENVLDLTSTRYSRPNTLNNDQYYWRVRPVDAAGNRPEWGVESDPPRDDDTAMRVWQLGRNWPEQPRLEHPAEGARVGDPFFYQWTTAPQASEHHLASRYVLQLSSDRNFDDGSGTLEQCTTVHTTWTLSGQSASRDCWPDAAGTWYWRVLAHDDHLDTRTSPRSDAISAQVGSFTYLPDLVEYRSPQAGQTVDVPVFEWEPHALASQYELTLTGPVSRTVRTTGTSFTWRTELPPGGYRWDVRTVDESGRLGVARTLGSRRQLTVVAPPAGTAVTPEPMGPQGTAHHRFPTLRWTPVAGADHYRVQVRRQEALAWTTLPPTFAYPAGEDDGAGWLNPGDHVWRVEAWKDGDLLSQGATTGRFTIVPPETITGHRAALTGTALDGAAGTDHCAATLPNECQNLRQTPVLRWDDHPEAGYYKVYLARDREMTNVLAGYPRPVESTMFMPPDALPDSQAGSAYFWNVVPCKAASVCGQLAHAAHAFNKKSVKVRLLEPAPGAVVADDVAFDWEDFRLTEIAPTEDERGATPLTTPARTNARYYRVQVATDPNFADIVDQATVDQSTFTSYTRTFPEGPLHWRVQAVDGSGNALAWSDVRTVSKQSPVPTGLAPASGGALDGTQQLSWHPLRFAASYDVEVYAGSELVVQENTQRRVFTPAVPVATSEQPYAWRVRRVDVKKRKGAWTPLTPFTVTGAAPTLVAPAEGTTQVHPTATLFSWLPHERAARYRFERRLQGATTTAEAPVTAATSWAPPALMSSGAWEWRVVALDADNRPLGASPWRTFSVRDRPQAVAPVQVSGSGAVGTVLTLSAAAWDPDPDQVIYQWLRDGRALTGQTGATYTVQPTDVDHSLQVRATARKAGYLDAESLSNTVVGGQGAPATPTEPPTVVGTPAVGQVLTALEGSWPGTARFAYQWYRGALPVDGATRKTYRVAGEDAGRTVKVVVRATVPGYAPGEAGSASVTIRRIASATAVTAPRSVRRTERATVAVTVTAPGLTAPTGPVRVQVGSKVVRTVNLSAAMRGRFSYRLPRQSVGTKRVTVTYLGSAAVLGSRRVVSIRVTR